MSRYILAYFKEEDPSLYLAESHDCLTFTDINNGMSIFSTTFKSKQIRDPFIFKYEDRYALVATSSWNGEDFLFATSTDLLVWENEKLVELTGREFKNIWAPEVFIKDDVYYIYWSSSKVEPFDHRMYFMKTKDFQSFSDIEVLFDPGYNVIDGTIVELNNDYYLVYKDERTNIKSEKTLKIAYTENLDKGFSIIKNDKFGQSISASWVEGPIVIKVESTDEYQMYYDEYTRSKWGLSSSNDLIHWKEVEESRFSLPQGLRHGSILKIK